MITLVINSYMLTMAWWLQELPSWIAANPSSQANPSSLVLTLMNLG
jgi:hypothetical protein